MRCSGYALALLTCSAALSVSSSLPALAAEPSPASTAAESQSTRSSAGETTSTSQSFEMVPGVVVDRGRPALFLMNPKSGIDAIDPRSGGVLWTSTAAAKPLLVSGSELLAQAEPKSDGSLRVVELTSADGTVRGALHVPLSSGVSASIDESLGSRFNAWAVERSGQIQLGWERVESRTSPLPPKDGEVSAKRFERGALLQLESNAVVPLTEAPLRPARAVARSSSDGGGEPRTAGAVLASARQEQGQLVLQRWEGQSNAQLSDVVLARGQYHLRMPSADGRHLLVSREAGKDGGEGYSFEVFSLETGESLGLLAHRRSHVTFFVVGNTFVYESAPYARRDGDAMVFSPRKLVGVDLATGSQLWERPLRDTKFRGQLPR